MAFESLKKGALEGRDSEKRTLSKEGVLRSPKVGMLFNVLTVLVFSFLKRGWSDSSDTRAASVTVSDGLALVKLALQVEPRRHRRHKFSQNEKKKKQWPLATRQGRGCGQQVSCP